MDLAINQQFAQYSRTQIQDWIKQQQITVNDQVITKPSYQVHPQDKISVTPSPRPALRAIAQPMPLDIIYEDHDVLVVNKPQGLVVHPSPGHPDHTLVNGILYHTKIASSDTIRPGIVHRIDKDTSGLLMIAKTELA